MRGFAPACFWTHCAALRSPSTVMGMKRKALRVGIVVLGCDKNTADAECFAGALSERLPKGAAIVALSEPGETLPCLDAVVIFTCAFIHDAKTESVETILSWTASKRQRGNLERVYVAGCLSERYKAELEKEIPEADGFVGVHELDLLLQALGDSGVGAVSGSCGSHRARKRLDNKPYAFLKIADGCDRRCTFCIIPAIKGGFASVPREQILAEAEGLLASGVRVINLVAQDTTAYGTDLYTDYRLADLLADICALPGNFWVRCLYCYPNGIGEALIKTMAAQPKIVPYLDIPLQHVSPRILKAMGRPEKPDKVAALLARLRRKVPGIVFRTTMLTGFPGEDEEDHRAMLEFMAAQRFEWLGAFTYSPEEGSPAASMKPKVPAAVARRRRDAVMELQAGITETFNRRREGAKELVLVEEFEEETGLWKGRSRSEAPEVDGMILIEGRPELQPGQFVTVDLIRADVYDMYARVLKDSPVCVS